MIDNTPAGIFAAMMRANASEQTAPQSRLYGLLSDHLQRNLANTYGDAGEAVYGAIIRSGEASQDVITGALEDYAYRQTERAAERAMRNAEATMRPANVTADYDCRHCLQRFTAAEFVWTGWFVNGENKGEFWTTCPAGHETVRHFPTNYSADTYNTLRNAAYDNALRAPVVPDNYIRAHIVIGADGIARPVLTQQPQSVLAARTAHRYVSRR